MSRRGKEDPNSSVLGVLIPNSILERLHLEATRSQTPIRTIVRTLLDERLPKNIRIVVADDHRARE